jgi:hypothetical protein
MNKAVLVLVIILFGLNCKGQVNIKQENDFSYRKGITGKVIVFEGCDDLADTLELYKDSLFIYTFIHVPGDKQYFRNLPSGKYYLISTYYNDSVVISNTDKIFIKNEFLNCEP